MSSSEAVRAFPVLSGNALWESGLPILNTDDAVEVRPESRKVPMQKLVASILKSYQKEPAIGHLGGVPLPRRDRIVEAIELLRELVFPGYFGQQGLDTDTFPFGVGGLIAKTSSILSEQVSLVLMRRPDSVPLSRDEAEREAESIVLSFLQEVPKLRSLLATDVQAAFEGDPAAADTDEIVYSYPGLFAVMIQRFAHELYLRRIPLIPRIMTEYAHEVTGIDIHAGASIGSHFFIDHGTGVVIGETTIIGNRVKIYQGVTLGAISTRGGQALRGAKRHPTIKDDVTIYSGASILGGETTINRGVVVGSNVLIMKTVPAHTRVSVKNPELQFHNKTPREFEQVIWSDWVI